MKKLRKKVNNLIPEFFQKLLGQSFFWLLFFAITRFIFLLYNREELNKIPVTEILKTFIEGIRVDLSTAAYMVILPFFLLFLADSFPKKWLLKINDFFSYILILAVSIITISELPIYDEWGHKLTYKAIWFLGNPLEVFHTASFRQLIFGMGGILILFLSGKRMFHYFIKIETGQSSGIFKKILFFLFAVCLIGVSLRGGVKPIPIQVSDAYFSRHNVINDASANSTFHLISNIMQNIEAGEPYHFMPHAEASQKVKNLFSVEKDTTIYFLKTKKPNIIMIILEGWSSDVIEYLGGYKGMAPFMSQIASRGISFDSCYASGSLSDQGMGAVFSAYPAQPRTSIITLPNKYVHLPCINRSFIDAGYETSFIFGGQLSYGNIKSYMYYNQFQSILEEKDFDENVFHGRLGVQDGDMLKRQLKQIGEMKQPFFSASFTLSTHAPFDFRGSRNLKWGDKENDYINSIQYADSCINQFLKDASKMEWYQNTLFVFISDHSHNTPKGFPFYAPEYRRMPMIFFGEVIKPEFKGTKSNLICSQLDLASTLMHQMDLDSRQFIWSKNLFNPYRKSFAFYADDGFIGWIRPEGRLVWFPDRKKLECERYKIPRDKKRLLEEGKAFLQKITEDFSEY